MSDHPQLDESVSIVPYDQKWVDLFQQESKLLQTIVEQERSLGSIEHIGSTSVFGLASKPIVDILIGLKLLKDTKKIVLAITTLGYEDMGEAGIKGRRYLRKRVPFAFNIHLVEKGSDLWRNNIFVRDYLRAHPNAVKEYGEHKCEVIASGADSLLKYSEQKFEYVQNLLFKAQNWNLTRTDEL